MRRRNSRFSQGDFSRRPSRDEFLDELEFGSIVYISPLRDGKLLKDHPAVILSSKAEIAAGKRILVVIISGNKKLENPEYMVDMHGGNPHPVTGLSKGCAAICTWSNIIAERDIIRPCGEVDPESAIDEIVEKFKRSGVPPEDKTALS